MGLQRNVAGQRWRVFAFNRTNNTPVTGDANNITAKIRKDWGSLTATNDVNPTELEDGFYEFELTQDETNASWIDLFPESSTQDVQVVGVPGGMATVPPNFNTLIIANNAVDADVERWKGNVPAGLVNTDKLPASIQHAATDVITAAALASDAMTKVRDAVHDGTVIQGTVDVGATTVTIPIKTLSINLSVTNQLKGRIILFTTDTATVQLRGQGAPILGNTTTQISIATENALTVAPAENDKFRIH